MLRLKVEFIGYVVVTYLKGLFNCLKRKVKTKNKEID